MEQNGHHHIFLICSFHQVLTLISFLFSQGANAAWRGIKQVPHLTFSTQPLFEGNDELIQQYFAKIAKPP